MPCERNYRVADLLPAADGSRWLIVIEQPPGSGQLRTLAESPHEWTTRAQLEDDVWGFAPEEAKVLRRGFDSRGRPVGPGGRRIREEKEKV